MDDFFISFDQLAILYAWYMKIFEKLGLIKLADTRLVIFGDMILYVTRKLFEDDGPVAVCKFEPRKAAIFWLHMHVINLFMYCIFTMYILCADRYER